jgi:hypothetical protein
VEFQIGSMFVKVSLHVFEKQFKALVNFPLGDVMISAKCYLNESDPILGGSDVMVYRRGDKLIEYLVKSTIREMDRDNA